MTNDTRLALWVAAALHDFGMFQPTQRCLDVENAIPLCRPILDAVCAPSLRPLVEFAIRNHDLHLLTDSRGTWGNLAITLAPDATGSALRARLRDASPEAVSAEIPVSDAAIEGLKFSVCLPAARAREVVRRRLVDIEGIRSCLAQPISTVTQAGPVGSILPVKPNRAAKATTTAWV